MKTPSALKPRFLLAAGLAALVSIPVVAKGAPVVQTVTLEAESMAAGSGTKVHANASASGGQARLHFSNSFSTATGIKGSIRSVTIRGRADTCGGEPRLRVLIDGYTVADLSFTSTSWADVSADIPDTAVSNAHVVTLSFYNDYYESPECDRNLWIDSVKLVTAVDSGTSGATPAPAPAPAATPAPTPAPAPTGEIKRLYVNPLNPAMAQADLWRTTRPADAQLLDKIGTRASATWIGGYSGETTTLANAIEGTRASKARLVLVLYGIPFRDGGQYSAGGHNDAVTYRRWIDSVTAQVGSTPTLTIVEPDAVAMDVNSTIRAERNELLRYAVTRLNSLPDNKVYLDAGNESWRTAAQMIPRLKAAGVDAADGFAVNVSNFLTTRSQIDYGFEIAAGVGGKPFVVDTSRNGNGPLPGATGEASWCNPPGRALGNQPTMTTGVDGVDAFIWAKVPGESDGACRGLPKAGVFMPSFALEMARNAKW